MTRRTGAQATGRRGRIRGFSAGGRSADIAVRMSALSAFTGGDRAAVLSALRNVRRARLQAPQAYDAVRHAALLRLLRQGRTNGAADPGAVESGKKAEGRKEDDRPKTQTAPPEGRRR